MMTPLMALFRRDLALSSRIGGGAMVGLVFFLAVVTIVPFGIGPDMGLLGRIGPAILWIGALLATLLGLDRLFQADQDDGSLDILSTGAPPLELVVLVKVAAHWLATGLPLVMAAPLLGLFLNLDSAAMVPVALTLLVGTPALTLMGGIGAALSVALRRGGLLMAVLVLPLTIPILIFGVAATTNAVNGLTPFGAPFAILCGLFLITLVVGPVASAAALRFGRE